MADSAFIVRVPEAEACVGALRERFDASARLGVPAHITILVPFMSPDQIDEAVLGRVQQAFDTVPAFAFALTRLGRFPATAYLAPEPEASFVALTRSLFQRFPAYPPFGGRFDSIIPHLTVAHGSASEADLAAGELAARMQEQGSIAGICSTVTLLENASGRWKEMHGFALPDKR